MYNQKPYKNFLIITTDIEAAVQHYASFYEHQILSDPASWAYLADKRWRRILVNASTPSR